MNPVHSVAKVYEEFRQPNKALYGPRPLWYWNGEMTPAEIERQLDEMVDKGVYSAYIFPWAGMRPRYLTEGWWSAVAVAIRKARELGFRLYFANEHLWPAGEARDYTLPGLPSRVLAARPDTRMRSLFSEIYRGRYGERIVVDMSEPPFCALAFDRTEDNTLDIRSCVDVTDCLTQEEGSWAGASADWSLYVFRLRDSVGVDGGIVDLMSKEATNTFIDVVYSEYERRFGGDFGGVLCGSRADHEGDYGYRLAWTPELFDTFMEIKGYDLRPKLPLLVDEGGPLTPKVRCDYFDVIARLYSQNFFSIIQQWSESRGLEFSGHVWEESLHSSAAFEGSHYEVQRAFEHPGVDSLFQWARNARHFKEAASVAHYRRKPLEVEYQEVEGHDSYLSLETAKITTNAIATWGGCIFVPGSFFAHPDRSDFPEPGYEDQPWWRYYKNYSDYVARLSYMNWHSAHVCRVLLYYPIESTWANAACVLREDGADYTFGDGTIDGMAPPVWGNVVDEIDDVYGQIVDMLPAHQWDLDVADYQYVTGAEVADGRIIIADEAYDVLILPPMTCISLEAARLIQRFAESGGQVVSVGSLPTDSMENGREDGELAAALGSSGIEHVADVESLLGYLDGRATRDVHIVDGDPSGITVRHMNKNGAHVYLLNNDNDEERRVTVQFATTGRPELWNPENGQRCSVTSSAEGGGTRLALGLGPWQVLFIVFNSAETADTQDRRPRSAASASGDAPAAAATLAPLVVHGPWRMTLEEPTIPACYARSREAETGIGEALGWHLPEYNDSFWTNRWLSCERFALRDWMIIGPFDYELGAAWSKHFPPEYGVDFDASYPGWHNEDVGWTRTTSDSHIVDLQGALGGDSGSWRTLGHRSATSFAVTHIYSPEGRQCELRVAANANAMAWLNGDLVFGERHEPPSYIELRDGYAHRTEIHLSQGWNQLMLRVSSGLKSAAGYGFYARVCDGGGNSIPGLEFSAVGVLPTNKSDVITERWYRAEVPSASSGVRLPQIESLRAYLDGRLVTVPADGTVTFAARPRQTLAIMVPEGRELPDHLEFLSGPVDQLLGSWSQTGLSHYSGSAIYETEFNLGSEYTGSAIELDLGRVGVACEAWLNGQWLGERVWRPYSFEITKFAMTGSNRLKVRVCNTRANRRAGYAHSRSGLAVNGPELLPNLENSGLLGPVRVRARDSGWS